MQLDNYTRDWDTMAKRNESVQDTPENDGMPTFAPSDKGVERKRKELPPVYVDAVSHSVDEPQMAVCASEDQAKTTTNYLRRAAEQLGFGLRVNTVYDNDRFEVHFQAKAKKAAPKYTANDIREWAFAHGYEVQGRIPADVRHAFKVANGYVTE